jgi:hypothetical protein
MLRVSFAVWLPWLSKDHYATWGGDQSLGPGADATSSGGRRIFLGSGLRCSGFRALASIKVGAYPVAMVIVP